MNYTIYKFNEPFVLESEGRTFAVIGQMYNENAEAVCLFYNTQVMEEFASRFDIEIFTVD